MHPADRRDRRLVVRQGRRPAGFEADGVWEALTPSGRRLAWVIDEGLALIHDGENWTPLSSTFKNLTAARSPFFANTRFEILEQEVTLSGASVATHRDPQPRHRAGRLDPHQRRDHRRDLLQLRRGRRGGQVRRSLGVAKNASNVGVIGPTAYYADTPVVITAAGGSFTGGKVRVSIHVMRFDRRRRSSDAPPTGTGACACPRRGGDRVDPGQPRYSPATFGE
jgi:hypothetical protein